MRERVRVHAGAAIDTLLTVMHDDKAPSAARVSAAVAILDRGYGRPAQAVYQQVTRHADELSDAELIAIATGGGESGAESDDGGEAGIASAEQTRHASSPTSTGSGAVDSVTGIACLRRPTTGTETTARLK